MSMACNALHWAWRFRTRPATHRCGWDVSIYDFSGNGYNGNLRDMDVSNCWETVIAIDINELNETVDWTTDSFSLSGTNSPNVTRLWWTNAANAASG
ncbi:hypothetical protein P4C99_02530 [Pontiellaceae bacterium B1224]|nr:hypothetical protein [Pontiellaceae bacterium B1224]